MHTVWPSPWKPGARGSRSLTGLNSGGDDDDDDGGGGDGGGDGGGGGTAVDAQQHAVAEVDSVAASWRSVGVIAMLGDILFSEKEEDDT